MVSCKAEISQDTQDYYCRPAYPTGLSYPIRYPHILEVQCVSNPSLPPFAFTVYDLLLVQ